MHLPQREDICILYITVSLHTEISCGYLVINFINKLTRTHGASSQPALHLLCALISLPSCLSPTPSPSSTTGNDHRPPWNTSMACASPGQRPSGVRILLEPPRTPFAPFIDAWPRKRSAELDWLLSRKDWAESSAACNLQCTTYGAGSSQLPPVSDGWPGDPLIILTPRSMTSLNLRGHHGSSTALSQRPRRRRVLVQLGSMTQTSSDIKALGKMKIKEDT